MAGKSSSLRLKLVDAARTRLKGMKKPSTGDKKFVDANAAQLKGSTRDKNPQWMGYIGDLRKMNAELKKLAGEVSPAEIAKKVKDKVTRTSRDRFGRNEFIKRIFGKLMGPDQKKSTDGGGEDGDEDGQED